MIELLNEIFIHIIIYILITMKNKYLLCIILSKIKNSRVVSRRVKGNHVIYSIKAVALSFDGKFETIPKTNLIRKKNDRTN